MTTDPLIDRLTTGAYGEFWNYAVRARAVAAVWAEPDSLARLQAVAGDDTAPLRARFLACEVLFERHFTFVPVVGHATVAGIYARALTEDLTGSANSWGLLYDHDDAGPTGIRFVMIGPPAIPALRALLDDDRQLLRYHGSKAATVGNAYGFRIKDFAAYYLHRITRLPIAFHAAPAERDRAIAELATRLDASP